MAQPSPESAAGRLSGRELQNGWRVPDRVPRPPGATGGMFSVGYHVESADERKGFLKALDIGAALLLSPTDPTRVLEQMLKAYNFECDLLAKCSERHFDRVMVPLDQGTIQVDAANPLSVVPYLIFDQAEGDVRGKLSEGGELDLAWALRTLHNITVGLLQLHSVKIAHQDLKPSNVLWFEDAGAMLTDLGRAAARGEPSPHYDLPIAGDPSYAPPELLYGDVPADWEERRLGCDLYMLGSMVTFFFMSSSMSALLVAGLPDPDMQPGSWRGRYSELLPTIRLVFSQVLEELATCLPEDRPSAERILEAVRQLCDPEPQRRGHPKNILSEGSSYALERYVSMFNLVATRAELRLVAPRPRV